MATKVLIVDDSGFFRRRLRDLIDASPQLEVIGAASNGREAVEKVRELKPDVITMDYEMPVMDGITAVRHIMAENPTPILMFSSLTYEGARVTLDSLEAGAVDYLPKNFEEIAKSSAVLKKRLHETLISVARSRPGQNRASTAASPASPRQTQTAPASTAGRAAAPSAAQLRTPAASSAAAQSASKPAPRSRPPQRKANSYAVVAIGTSTGGPVALLNVLKKLPKNYPLPIVLIQHMPASFTQAFAERLNSQCLITIKQANDGDRLLPGIALLAPGGKQLMIGKGGVVRILPGDDRLNYKPSVDVTFGSAANVFDSKVLAIILTGMGADGRDGARILKSKGSTIWAQDEASSTIYGMPMAVAKAGLTDEILSLNEIGPRLLELV